jgi:hypothetical protein
MREWFSKPSHEFGFNAERNECAYKIDSNHKCAVGSLLTEKLYDESMEGKGVTELIDKFKGVARLFEGVEIEFLVRAQRMHDDTVYDYCLSDVPEYDFDGTCIYKRFTMNETGREKFLSKLDTLASEFGLKVVT